MIEAQAEEPIVDGVAAGGFAIQTGDAEFNFATAYIADAKVVGSQIVEAAGIRPADDVVVLQHLPSGELESLRMNETVDLTASGVERFFVLTGASALNRVFVDRLELAWPYKTLAARHIKFLAKAKSNEQLVLDSPHGPVVLDDDAIVDISKEGVEHLRLEKQTWALNVHGVPLTLSTPTIIARDALVLAGFDPKDWRIILKVVGAPAVSIGADDVVDLRTPGIEKLRLMKDDVNNGEAPAQSSRAFALLAVDEAYLNRLGLRWETVVEGQRRWLLIHNYPVLPGYEVDRVILALEIPPDYPGAAIYGFFTYPPLKLTNGRQIPNPRPDSEIAGRVYTGWSRYRSPVQWDANIDNVVTQLALVEQALEKEVAA